MDVEQGQWNVNATYIMITMRGIVMMYSCAYLSDLDMHDIRV